MFGIFLESVPVVGHGVAIDHYRNGDTEAGNRALYKATRTTAVVGGGFVGGALGGGPVGQAVGGIAGGLIVDTAATVITNEKHGYIQCISDIVEDVSNGGVPIESVTRTSLLVGSDIYGGMLGGSFSQCTEKAIEESVKSMGRQVFNKIIADGVGRMADMHKSEPSANKTSSSSSGGSGGQPPNSSGGSGGQPPKSSGGSGGQPPKNSGGSGGQPSNSSGGSDGQPPNNNPNNNKKQHRKEKRETHWEAFLKIFNKKTLDEIVINGKNIFKDIGKLKDVLQTLIKKIRKSEDLDLERIVNITIKVLLTLEKDDIHFYNFLTVAKFVVAYVHEQITDRFDDLTAQSPPNLPNPSGTDTNCNTRRIQIAEIITSEITNSTSDLVDVLKGLAKKITDLMPTINPQFGNILTAVYHYFKHKVLPNGNGILTPNEYFLLAREAVKGLQAHREYQELIDRGDEDIVYLRYDEDIGKRLKIVLKYQGGCVYLSSCYYTDEQPKDEDDDDEDKDGDEWINGVKLPRK